MADLFIKQAKKYVDSRPSYPAKLFEYIASKTPAHDLAWDVGTGSGQAAQSLARLYTSVIGTDTSPNQLHYATKLPNILYRHTPPIMSEAEVQQLVAPADSVDLVTIAQALHWFDFPTFYRNVRRVLKKPHGVIAAWCYSFPEVSTSVDSILRRVYAEDVGPYWESARKLVDEKYNTIEFPFEAVEGEDETGPFEFTAEKAMVLEEYLTYVRSWSVYQIAKDEGVEILSRDVIEEFEAAWNEDGKTQKVAKFPVHLKIGKV